MKSKLCIAYNLKTLRKHHNLTYKQLADELGVAQGYLHSLETEKKDSPGVVFVIKLANYFNVTLQEFCFHKILVGEKEYEQLCNH